MEDNTGHKEAIPANMQKYYNYRNQMSRLKKALNAGFYLEAIFIEYAVMEDRLESVLRHSGKFNPKRHDKIKPKLSKIREMAREKKSLAEKCFSEELLNDIEAWLGMRNALIHALMKQSLTTEELRDNALRGQELVKLLNARTSSYNRKLDLQKEKIPCQNS